MNSCTPLPYNISIFYDQHMKWIILWTLEGTFYLFCFKFLNLSFLTFKRLVKGVSLFLLSSIVYTFVQIIADMLAIGTSQRKKMDEPALRSTAAVSTGRRRLKTVISAVAGILIVLLLGAVGYLAYKTVCKRICTLG